MYTMCLFEPDIKMPHSDFALFRACNNADRLWMYKQSFYQLKNELLEKYADHAGYDKQEVEYKCDACRGTGWYNMDRRCYRCLDGVYSVRVYYLKRYVLNGQLFHRPVDRVDGPINKTIKGLVEHSAPEINPGFAYACLLKKYKQDEFYAHLRRLRGTFTRADWKKWGEIAARSGNIIAALQEWYGVEVDELPF